MQSTSPATRVLRDPLKFMLAGKAIFTVVNDRTGNRFTYRVDRAKDARPNGPWFVKVLVGPDNGRHYKYLGCLWHQTVDAGPRYAHGRKSKVQHGAPSVRALQWTLVRLVKAGALPEFVRILHEGRCGRCGKRLTVPESIDSGYGPECRALITGGMVG